MSDVALWRRLLAELLGSGFLAAVVIGSGIAAQRLSSGDTGLELLENAAATAAGLFAIILMFGPVSGGHFNPVGVRGPVLAGRRRLPARPGGGMHRRRDRRQPDVLRPGGQHLGQ
jgi:glycerol uptake facilitator-like aquaporin